MAYFREVKSFDIGLAMRRGLFRKQQRRAT
jgi:hypothetical protein